MRTFKQTYRHVFTAAIAAIFLISTPNFSVAESLAQEAVALCQSTFFKRTVTKGGKVFTSEFSIGGFTIYSLDPAKMQWTYREEPLGNAAHLNGFEWKGEVSADSGLAQTFSQMFGPPTGWTWVDTAPLGSCTLEKKSGRWTLYEAGLLSISRFTVPKNIP